MYLLGLLILGQQVLADEDQAAPPSTALLEFLGGAEMTEGEWVDPLDMQDLQDDATAQAGQQEKQDNE